MHSPKRETLYDLGGIGCTEEYGDTEGSDVAAASWSLPSWLVEGPRLFMPGSGDGALARGTHEADLR